MGSWLKTNEHPIERVVRVAVGLGLVGMAVTGAVGLWGYLGLVLVVTGLAGTCPVYTMLGLSTCPVNQRR